MVPRRLGRWTCVLALAIATPAAAAVAPLDGQVNDDPAAGVGIDPARPAGISDVVGGALTAGNVEVPWAAFEQGTPAQQNIFVRVFRNGSWVTQGFPASFNIDPNQEAEAPSIDFAGAGRTVPWVAWYEPNSNLGGGTATQIFASRFAANAAAQGGGVWIPEGQDRTSGSKVPSLNINPGHTAENPAVAGGATVAGNDPVPWVAWEENDGQAADDDTADRQIFVSKAIKLPTPNGPCATTPAGPAPNASVGTFCWQEVGARRLNPTTEASSSTGDPTLNVDPTRDGIEPDFAFTGPNDTVGWVVWYETGT